MLIESLPFKFDVSQAQQELAAHSDLWDEFPMRTEHPLSPHREMSDIFMRYNARENYHGNRQEFNQEHESVWWNNAEQLPSIKAIAENLNEQLQGRLGMVLVTRLPAGKQCYPHVDAGWHARFYEKYAIQIASNEQQQFVVEGKALTALPGECYTFNNSHLHWVINDSDEDRITLIVCIRSH